MDRQGLSFFHAVVWDKGGLGMGWRYRRNYEMVMIAHRKGGKLKWECKDKGAITANVVRLRKIIPLASEHPTPKPVSLPMHFLNLHASMGDLILDPFIGEGPVALAAIMKGCRYIGIELDEHWCRRAVNHIQEALAQPMLGFEVEKGATTS
jgi:site-specific DNA-methyltransferase (adenine-specific)